MISALMLQPDGFAGALMMSSVRFVGIVKTLSRLEFFIHFSSLHSHRRARLMKPDSSISEKEFLSMSEHGRTLVLAVLAILGGGAARAEPLAAQHPAGQTQEDDQARSTWLYYNDSGTEGRFKKGNGRDWIEKTTDGGEMRFVEVARTAEYVELYDRTRLMRLRLAADHASIIQSDRPPWRFLYSGHWTPVEGKPTALEATPLEKAPGPATEARFKVLVPSIDPTQAEKALNQLGERVMNSPRSSAKSLVIS